MEKFDINSLNLQDMRLLTILSAELSVSRTAEKLGLSQSSASYGLEKLRRIFSDPLFVRQGAKMVATQRGLDLSSYCRDVLMHMDMLVHPAQFHPETSTRHYKIAATSYEVHCLLADAHQTLRQQAPNITLQLAEIELPIRLERLQDDWDVVLSPSVPELSGVQCRKLFDDEYLTFFDPGFTDPPDSIETFARAQHAIAAFGDTLKTNVDSVLESHGLSRTVSLAAASFDHLPILMCGTPLISTLPSRFANTLFKEFSAIPAPIPLPRMALYMVWSENKASEPGHIWLRTMLSQFGQKAKLDR